MLGDVEADAFGIRRDPERQHPVDEMQHDIGNAEGEDAGSADAERLHAELFETGVTVRKERYVAEKRHGERAPDAGGEMHRHGIDRVVDPEPREKIARDKADDAAARADENGVRRRHDVAVGGDGDETGENAVQRQLHVRQSVADPADADDRKPARRRRQHGVDEDEGNRGIERERRAAIEAEPADPEQEHAERRHRHVVRLDALAVRPEAADAGTEHEDRGERDPAADGMDDGRAREVDETAALEPAGRLAAQHAAPGPVAEDGIDQHGEDGGRDRIAAKAHAFGDGARDDGGGGRTEGELEEEEGHDPGGRLIAACDAVEGEVGRAEKPARADTEHEAEADEPEADARDAEIHHVLDGDVDRVLCANETGFETGEACLHEQHEHGTDQHPDRVYRLRNAFHHSPPLLT